MITAIVLTKNEEQMLPVCLESIKWVDEIVVVDDNSQDATVSIAKKYTSNVSNHALEDFAKQRQFAQTQANGEWLLYIDPDERVTKQLREAIQQAVTSDAYQGYSMPRRNFFLGKEQQYVGAWPDNVIRLIKKSALKGFSGELHEQPHIEGNLGHITEPLIHLTHRNITSMTQKTLNWSVFEAQLRFNTNHPQMNSFRFLRMFFTSFFDWYIVKKGYKGGTEGTIEAIFQTFSVFMTYVRLWEMQRNPSLEEAYKEIDEKLIQSNFGSAI